MKNDVALSIRKRRNVIFVCVSIIIGLCVAFALMTTAYLLTDMRAADNKARLNDYYFEALNELSDEVDETVLNLSKLTLSLSKGSTAAELNALSRHSAGAACALSRLPIDCEKTYSAMKLLNQIIDFAASYGFSLARGMKTDGFVESAMAFRKAAETLQQRVDEMMRRSVEKGEIDCSDFSPEIAGLGNETQHETPDYPEMIYDGPFSDSRLPVSFKGLENLPEIDEEEAVNKAESLLLKHGAVIVGKSSSPEAYEIECGDSFVALSVRGGMVLELIVPGDGNGGKNLSEDDVYTHAAEYAAKLGYGDLYPVWYHASGSVGYVNMAPKEGDAILYTDLVKVKISLDDGTLLGLEATGYCRNHIKRIIEPKISEATAAKLSGIDYDFVRLCVIPDGETEATCFEVHGMKEDMEFYVYVDAVSGEKIKAMKVVTSDGGRLTA
ncbi:MAG: hypothetical protein HFK09_03025 [Clostridia bacterium]|nr:hypothetical protein [Clostridia bacterium]